MSVNLPFLFVATFASSLISPPLIAVAICLAARVLGGKGGFMPSIHAMVLVQCGMTAIYVPFMLLVFIPCLGAIASLVFLPIGIYGLYGCYKIAKQANGLSRICAIIAVLVGFLAVTFALGLVSMAVSPFYMSAEFTDPGVAAIYNQAYQ